MSQEQQTPEEIRLQIERTRTELGDTVEALSQKADVKEQARQKKDEVKEQARQKKDEVQQRVAANRTPLLAVGGGFVALLVLRRILRGR